MIEYKNNSNNNVVELTVDGKITTADFKSLMAKVEADFAKYGKLRVLEDIHSFKGIDPMVLWSALQQIRRIYDVTHAAIVVDAKWLRMISEVISGIYPFEIKVFERSLIEEARFWLANC
ncbi:MAG: STAS/SEC14 domain-containing protein [Acaryochloris sp. CRU_2_0]|nr:STAS/SEC14 domain-containing protein [Acaryochloris sp. CRU_2_0]